MPVPKTGCSYSWRFSWGLALVLLGSGLLAPRLAGAVGARRQYSQTWDAVGATIQYSQILDEEYLPAVLEGLGSDRTFRFRYEEEWTDDHVFPNGVRMRQIHEWLTRVIEAWNRQPLMPVRLTIERGYGDAPNIIKLDPMGSETGSSGGIGGWSSEWLDQTRLKYHARAAINLRSGYNADWESFEATAKHELGHCLALGHSANRASAMAYLSLGDESDARTGYFFLDDLLGLRSLWARTTPGFGALAGRVVYRDGTPVGAADVVAVEEATGAVLASSLSDRKRSGQFRIELPAGRRVRLVAHPVHADVAMFGEHFLQKELLTPDGFEPTELLAEDRTAVVTVPDGATQVLPLLTVTPPADPPLLQRDALSMALLPGERRRVSFRFKGLATDPAQVRLSLGSLSASHVVTRSDRVEFDVAAAPDAAGVSTLEVRSGAATNLQVGSLWVRPVEGLVRATRVDPLLLVRGQMADVVIHGLGLDRVTDVQFVREGGSTRLPTRLVGPTGDGGLQVKVDVPDTASEGPWQIMLTTAEGAAPRAPEDHPRFWTGRGRLEAERLIDLGDVPIKKTLQIEIPVTNVSSTSYGFSGLSILIWFGQINSLNVTDWPEPAPGGTGPLRLSLTPNSLGPTVMFVKCLGDGKLDGVCEVRWWGIPSG